MSAALDEDTYWPVDDEAVLAALAADVKADKARRLRAIEHFAPDVPAPTMEPHIWGQDRWTSDMLAVIDRFAAWRCSA